MTELRGYSGNAVGLLSLYGSVIFAETRVSVFGALRMCSRVVPANIRRGPNER